MESISRDVNDLRPEERQAAEKLLGRSLVDFQKVVVRVLGGGRDVVVRFIGGKETEPAAPPTGKWAVPACFNVLADLSQAERAELDAALAEPVKLSRHE